MTRARLWKRLRAARWWIVAAALVGVAAGVVVAWKLVQPTYETSAVAEYRAPESIAGVDPPPLVGTLEGLRSQTTLRELRERLGLDVPTEQLAARFDLGYERRTQVLSVDARGATAEEAETLANAVVELLVERQNESYARRVERARRRASEQLEEAQGRTEEADRAFEAFQRETGLDGLSFDERRVLSEAATVEAERASAEARVAALEHRITQLAEEMGAAPQQLSASVRAATQERNQLAQLRTKLATAEATLDPGHPRRQALERQTRALRLQQVSRSMQDQGQSGLAFQHLDRLSSQQSAARANLEAERERLARLTEQAAAAQERASDVAEHADEAATLMARRRAARDRVAELSSLEAHLEAISTPDGGLRPVGRAVRPEAPSNGKKRIMAAVGIPIALVLLVIAVALGLELGSLRAWTPEEIAWWGSAPVIGATPWPAKPEAYPDLLGDLKELGEPPGTTLIVPFSEAERAQAEAMAEALGSPEVFAEMGLRAPGPAPAPPAASPPAASPPAASPAAASPAVEEAAAPREEAAPTVYEPWLGPLKGPKIRRQVRLSDRVVLVVRAGTRWTQLVLTARRLGRPPRVGYLVLDLPTEHLARRDRVGPVRELWMGETG